MRRGTATYRGTATRNGSPVGLDGVGVPLPAAAGVDERDDDPLLAGALEAVDRVDGRVGAAADLGDLCAERRDDADVVDVDAGVDVSVDHLGDPVGLDGVGVPLPAAAGVDERDGIAQFRREVGDVDPEVRGRPSGDLGRGGAQRPVVELRRGERLDALAHAVLAVEHHAGVRVGLDEALEQRLPQFVLGADDRRELLVVADEDEAVGAVDRRQRPRLSELGRLVDDRGVERLLAHRPGAAGGGGGGDDRRAVERRRAVVRLPPGDEPAVLHVVADAVLRAHAEGVVEPLLSERLQGVVDRAVRERREQHAVAPLDERADDPGDGVRLPRPRRAVDEREVLGVHRAVHGRVLGVVVVDVQLVVGSLTASRLAVRERRLPAPEQHVLAVGVALEDEVVDRGVHPRHRQLGGVDVETTELDGLVGLHDDRLPLAAQLPDPAELGVAARRVALGDERDVALAELRDGVRPLAGREPPAAVADRLPGDGVQVDQRAVVGRPLRGALFPQLSVLGVRLPALRLDRPVRLREVLPLRLRQRAPDLTGLRLLVEPAGDDHAGVLLETVLAGRVGLVPRGDGDVELRGGDLVALADDELQQPLPHRELLGRREVARRLAAVERRVLRVQQRARVGLDPALAQQERVAGRLDFVLEAGLAVRVLPRLELDGLAPAQRVRPPLHAEGGGDERVLGAPLRLVGAAVPATGVVGGRRVVRVAVPLVEGRGLRPGGGVAALGDGVRGRVAAVGASGGDGALTQPPFDRGGVAPHLVGDLVALAPEQAQLQPRLRDAVGDGVLQGDAAQQVAEHLVDHRPLDHGVVQRDAGELVEIVHPRALHPRADVGYVDEEVGFEHDVRLRGGGVPLPVAVVVPLGVGDEQLHPGLGVLGGVGPLPPEGDGDRLRALTGRLAPRSPRGLGILALACPAVGPDRELREVALAVLRAHLPDLADLQEGTADVHYRRGRPLGKNGVGGEVTSGLRRTTRTVFALRVLLSLLDDLTPREFV